MNVSKYTILKTSLFFILILTLPACNRGNTNGSSLQSPTQDAKSRFASHIIGLWDYTSQDGWHRSFDFTRDGRVIITENYVATYEIMSEQTIAVKTNGENLIMRVVDYSEDKMVIEDSDSRKEFVRAKGNPNLRQDIIGLWVAQDDDSWMIEFTSQGISLGSDFGHGTFEVLSDYSIVIKSDQIESDYILRIGDVFNDKLVLGMDGATFLRVKGYPNLQKDLIGIWRDQIGSLIEFTDTGKVVDHDFEGVYDYQVLSNTTIWISTADEEQGLIVLEISPNKLSFVGFGESFEYPQIFFKEQ